MDSIKLKSIMVLNRDNQQDLSKYLGISPQRLSLKLNEKLGAEFTQTEIALIKQKYNLTPEDIDSIFFKLDVSKKDTKQLV